jgi:hypothetical protein
MDQTDPARDLDPLRYLAEAARSPAKRRHNAGEPTTRPPSTASMHPPRSLLQQEASRLPLKVRL